METFNFPFHRMRVEYPPTAPNIQLGRSYVFASRPLGPFQRKFILSFESMVIYQNVDKTADLATQPLINFMLLDKFYRDHGTHEVFIYPHELEGNMEVRFADPFKWPDGHVGGNGSVKPFEINLIEVIS